MKPALKRLSSLNITVFCLISAMVLVFFGTIEQVDTGVLVAQQKFFRCFFVSWTPEGFTFPLPVFPGGYTLATLLLINLTAAFIGRFRYRREKGGILLIHSGLMLIILGEVITAQFAEEMQMPLRTGDISNHMISQRGHELAISDTTNAEFDQVVAVAEHRLKKGAHIATAALPFSIRIRELYPNSELINLREKGLATRGIGRQVGVRPIPLSRRDNERNITSAIIEIRDGNSSLGTWLLSTGISVTQPLNHNGRHYALALRSTRHYMPYSIKLTHFTHEKYPGTNIPKEFASRVKVFDGEGQFSRESLISMNQPLYLDGKTFYQASYGEEDNLSILLVVDNPGVWIPYIASSLVTGGLLLQFLISFQQYRRRRSE
jgi:hypothetical protein